MVEITKDWQDYERGKDYNRKLKPDLYTTVDKNERFYAGDQWAGVQSNGLPTPVFNIFKRIINYFISAIMSQKVKIAFFLEGIPDETEDPMEQQAKETADFLTKYANTKWEHIKMDSKLWDVLLDGAISGDMGFYTYWDDSIDTGQMAQGDFVTETIDNVNVYFGNPNEKSTEKQPYILVDGRDTVENLQNEARKYGVDESLVVEIAADTDYQEQSGDRGKVEIDHQDNIYGRTTFLLRFWKDKTTGTVHFRKSTKNVVIREDVDTRIKRYPIAWGNWDARKNSYHGQALGTGLIPNQIYINKQFALVMKHMMDTAFSKAIYDSTRIGGWSNAVGTAIPVKGDITGAATYLNPGQMSANVMDTIDQAIALTKDLMGANDAALGDVKPDNTSAIIAVQKAAAIPLEKIKANLYQLVEDLAYIWLEYMLNYYNVPRKLTYEDNGQQGVREFTGTDYQGLQFRIKVEVGPSSYWSEISSMQTLDNLLTGGYIEFADYLKRIPDGMIPDKQSLIEKIENQMQQNQLMYEQMARFMEQLPPEIQAILQQMKPEEMEPHIQEMMMMDPETLQMHIQDMMMQAQGGKSQ